MQCRQCGTEIADKAIVCYRCGTATSDPVRRAAAPPPRGRGLVPLALIAALVLIALYLGQASRTAANPDWLQLAAGLCAGGALVVLLTRVLRRQ
ncbi:MAG TPA: hypothetical protein VLD67_19265 [Vicinamibacterales bacterium]|nr:hypothetical protein [Vicinamibacterales bacterium]